MKIKITCKSVSKSAGQELDFIIEGELKMNPDRKLDLNDHDIASRLFAIEFATNNHAQLPIRLWIEEA